VDRDAALRQALAAKHRAIMDKIAQQRALRLAKTDEPLDAAQCRALADRCGLLAQQTRGKRRLDLLDAADQWDELAQAREGLAVA